MALCCMAQQHVSRAGPSLLTITKRPSFRAVFNRAYKQVFSNPQVLRSFLTGFVSEPWVALVEFSSLRVASADFPEISGGRREGDLLVEVSLAGGGRALLFLLLEFQSSPEAMALRLLEYMQGRVAGREEGVQGVVKRMLAEGFSVQEIVRATGLPEEQIQALKGRR